MQVKTMLKQMILVGNEIEILERALTFMESEKEFTEDEMRLFRRAHYINKG